MKKSTSVFLTLLAFEIGALMMIPAGYAASCVGKAVAQHVAFAGTLHCYQAPSPRLGTVAHSVNLVAAPSHPSAHAQTGACAAVILTDPTACQPAPGPAAAPVVTSGMVLQAFQRIPVPHLRAKTQPAGRTLVNFDTIFYVEANGFQRALTLLGQRVTLAIRPSGFAWHHGDGTTATTSEPGARYPSKDIVYRYQRAHVTVAHHVTITWSARYRVGNGPWRAVPGVVITDGPTTELQIAEATPVLTGRR